MSYIWTPTLFKLLYSTFLPRIKSGTRESPEFHVRHKLYERDRQLWIWVSVLKLPSLLMSYPSAANAEENRCDHPTRLATDCPACYNSLACNRLCLNLGKNDNKTVFVEFVAAQILNMYSSNRKLEEYSSTRGHGGQWRVGEHFTHSCPASGGTARLCIFPPLPQSEERPEHSSPETRPSFIRPAQVTSANIKPAFHPDLYSSFTSL